MRTFVFVVLALLLIEIYGKATMIYQKNYQRNPKIMLLDIALALGMATWAAYLLGQSE